MNSRTMSKTDLQRVRILRGREGQHLFGNWAIIFTIKFRIMGGHLCVCEGASLFFGRHRSNRGRTLAPMGRSSTRTRVSMRHKVIIVLREGRSTLQTRFVIVGGVGQAAVRMRFWALEFLYHEGHLAWLEVQQTRSVRHHTEHSRQPVNQTNQFEFGTPNI